MKQEEWEALGYENRSITKGPDYPVTHVNWDDTQEFIASLNLREPSSRYRLPTEAEWEYAACVGNQGPDGYGAGTPTPELKDFAWYGS